MKFILLLCLCLVTLTFAISNEKELKSSIESCCTGHCSQQALDSLHEKLTIYSRSQEVDSALVNFGMEVFGGKRCDGQVRSARNYQVSARNSRARAVGDISINCNGTSIYYAPGKLLNCSVHITNPNGLYWVGGFGEVLPYYFVECANPQCNYYANYSTSFSFLLSLPLTESMPVNVITVTAFYYLDYYNNFTSVSKNVTVLGLPGTTTGGYSTTRLSTTTTGGSTTGRGNNNYTNSITIKCPSTYYSTFGYGLACVVTVIAPFDNFYYSGYLGNFSCDGCNQYYYGAQYYNYTVYFNTNGYTGYWPISVYFYSVNGNYYYSEPAYVNIIYTAPQINVTKFVGPSSLPPNFNTFNVQLNINSTFGVSNIYVYYIGDNYYYGAVGSYYNYYPYSNGSFTVTVNQYNNFTSGRFCPVVEVYDTQSNYAYFTNFTCYTIVNSGCQAGYYKSVNSSLGCLPCPQGFYSEFAGACSCTPCASGYSSSCSSASRSCVICPAGTSSKGGACVPCASGTSTPYSGQSTCNPCSPGNYANGTGNTYCTYCNAGSYSCAGASNCTLCKAGTYSSYGGASVCLNCANGYSSNAGSYYCYQCPANTYAVSGSGTCTQCPAGQISPPGSFACYTAKK